MRTERRRKSSTAKRLWARSESRELRPFNGSDVLATARLRLNSRDQFESEPIVVREELDPDEIEIVVQLPDLLSSAFDAIGLDFRDLEFVAAIEDRFFQHFRIVERFPVAEAAANDLEIESAARASSWAGETAVHLAVVLARSRSTLSAATVPSRVGHIISRKVFSIRRPKDEPTFKVVSVGEDFFTSRQLPSSTTHIVEILGDLEQPADEVASVLVVYVNDRVTKAMSSRDGTGYARAIAAALQVDVVTTILKTGFTEVSGYPVQGSVLDTALSNVSRATGISKDAIRSAARENNDAQLRAIIQAQAGLTDAITAPPTGQGGN